MGISVPKQTKNSVDLFTGKYHETCEPLVIPGPSKLLLTLQQDEEGIPFASGWSLHATASERCKKEFTYDEEGRLTSFPFGVITYESEEFRVNLDDGRSWSYLLDSAGRVEEIVSPDGQRIRYTYAFEQVAAKSSSWGMHFVNLIDPETGRVTEQQVRKEREGALETVATLRYGESEVEESAPWGESRVYRFDQETLTCTVFAEGELVCKEEYLLNGEQARIFDAKGTLLKEESATFTEGKLSEERILLDGIEQKRTFSYDSEGRLVAIVQSSGATVRFTYGGDGELFEESHYLGEKLLQKKRFAYEESALVLEEQESETARVEILYTPSKEPHCKGLPVFIERKEWEREKDELIASTVTLIGYTHSGLPTTHVEYDLLEETTLWAQKEYDVAGRETFISDASGKTLAMRYDDEAGIYYAVDKVSGSESVMWVDALGNILAKEVRTSGSETLLQQQTYDLRGLLLESTDTLGAKTTYQYNALGQLLQREGPQVLDSAGKPVRYLQTFRYDALGRLAEMVTPEGAVTKALYRGAEKPYAYQLANGEVQEPAAEPQAKRHAPPEQSKEQELPTVERRLDKERHLLIQEARFATGLVVTSEIDALGRTQAVTTKEPSGKTLFHKECRYNSAGQLTKERVDVYFEGRLSRTDHTSWDFTAEGKLERKVEEREGSTETTYYGEGERGALKEVTKPNGVTLTTRCDTEGRVVELLSSDGTLHYSYSYGETEVCLDHILGGSVERRFDEEGRLVYESQAKGLSLGHRYDSSGKRLETHFADGSTVLYKEGRLQRSTPSGKTLYAFSKEQLPGNLGKVQRTEDALYAPHFSQEFVCKNGEITAVKEGGKKRSLRYDAMGQLIFDGQENYRYTGIGEKLSLEKCTGEKEYDALDRLTSVKTDEHIVRYSYDGYNRRVSRALFDRESGELIDEESYLYDGREEIGSSRDGVNFTTLKIASPEAPGQFVLEKEGELYSCLQDLRGATRLLYDLKSGKLVETYDYTSFGKLEQKEALSPWLFAGRRLDFETGLINFGRRDYDPLAGSFITKDPAGQIDGSSPYTFAQNDPWGKTDFGGYFSISSAAGSITDWYRRFHPVASLRYHIETLSHKLLGPRYVSFWFGLKAEPSETGVYGEGELHDNYRITFVNGILTNKKTLLEHLDLVSKSHGGRRVYYCYVGTRGWAADLARAAYSKLGFVSPEAQVLADTWKQLIRDLGGPGNGGIIFHYAHSQGGTETLRALYLLTPEEQRMISVITMGSPTLIADDGRFHSVINIISCRDLVPIFSPLEFFHALIVGGKNVLVMGSFWDGLPVVDHLFPGYWNYWEKYEFFKLVLN